MTIYSQLRKSNLISKKVANKSSFKRLNTYSLTGFIVLLGISLSLCEIIDLRAVIEEFPWGIIAIYITMDAFTDRLVQTGIMERLSFLAAKISQGRPQSIAIVFFVLLFLISSCLNNITAIFAIFPILKSLFKAIPITTIYGRTFFSLLLVTSNLGGAASPIGDFPAIIILKSGITNFNAYLLRAFPLFLATGCIVVSIYVLVFLSDQFEIKRENNQEIFETFGKSHLNPCQKYRQIDYKTAFGLLTIFGGMCLAWAFLPTQRVPAETIAIAGAGLAYWVNPNSKKSLIIIDLKPVIALSGFLLLASGVSNSGILSVIGEWMRSEITDPNLLLLAIMGFTTLTTGIFSAGPTAAAMMPIISELGETVFLEHPHLLAVAFAASICAGSSMFLSSATAGFILMGKINSANLRDNHQNVITWNFFSYLKFGLFSSLLQFICAVIWVIILLSQ